ncbi:MAG TPA: ANTAR domain-containing protein, partial [Pseudonocardia sp.]|nr:ANTAR domain-containing protein [Pseudonocardia sp.]
EGRLPEDDLRLGQALADAATIGILPERAVREQELLADPLQGALNSRVVIEQAKGVLAERGRSDVDTALAVLRRYARNTNQRLTDVARAVVDGSAPIDAVLLGGPPETRSG